MINNCLLLIFSTLLVACQPQVKTIDECDELAMHAYRGWPKALSDLQKDCAGISYTYTHDRCQKAFGLLILGKNEMEMKKLFGEKIMKCFNQIDIERFAPKPTKTDSVMQNTENSVHSREDKGSSSNNHHTD